MNGNNWVRSTYCSGGSCLEVQFVRASACSDTNCVEVGHDGAEYLIRDSKNPEQAPLRFTAAEFSAFTAGVVAGEFRFGGGNG